MFRRRPALIACLPGLLAGLLLAGGARTEEDGLEAAAARGEILEAQIEAELRRQQDLLREVERAEALAAAPPHPEPAPDLLLRADPRVAPAAPSQRELPLAIFDEERVEIAAQRWGNPQPFEATRLVLDADRDGSPEQVRFYDAGRERLLRLEQDRDYDGRLDDWRSFEDGVLASREIDSNGDGRADVFERYRDGAMRERAVDRDGDGVLDAFYVYETGLLVEERHDADNDGAIEVRTRYENRRRVSSEEDRNGDGAPDTWTSYQVVDGEELVSRIERASRGGGSPDVFESYDAVGGRAVLSRRDEDRDGDGEIDIRSIYENGRLVRRLFADASSVPR